MRLLTIDGSPSQIRKLRKGSPVRIKKGTGFNLIVSPENYKLATRAFNKNKGMQVKLSPEEIAINHKASISPEMHRQIAEDMAKETGTMPQMAGQGIFGKSFDKFLAKTGLNKITDPLGDVLKPLAKKGISAVAGMAKNLPITKMIPGAEKVVSNVEDFATDYLDNPSKYNEGDRREAMQRIKSKVLTGNGMRSNVSRAVAHANAMNADITNRQIAMRRKPQKTYDELKHGQFAPFSRGYGVHRSNNSIVGCGGGMLSHHLPPALMSQPYSANYQMSHFLPPQYQHFNNSPMGFGLYL